MSLVIAHLPNFFIKLKNWEKPKIFAKVIYIYNFFHLSFVSRLFMHNSLISKKGSSKALMFSHNHQDCFTFKFYLQKILVAVRGLAIYWPHIVATRLQLVDIRKCLIFFKKRDCYTQFRSLNNNHSLNLVFALWYSLNKQEHAPYNKTNKKDIFFESMTMLVIIQ